MPANPFTTFKNNYSGNPSGTEKSIDSGILGEMNSHYSDFFFALHGVVYKGKKDPRYGTVAKQAEIMKHVAQRIDEFEKTAGTYLEQALKAGGKYYSKLALSDLSLLEKGPQRPEQFHYDYNENYVKKAFTDSFEHIAAQTNRMATTIKHDLRADSQKILRRAAVEGWPRKKAYRELRDEILGRDPAFKFTDKRGRQWKSEDYFDMLTKTVMKNIQNECYANTLINEGRDLVKVNHNGATDPCRFWEGKILSLTGATPGYTTVDEARATGEVFHPRCRHRLVVYDAEMDDVFNMIDAGVSAGKVIGSSKKAVREAVEAIPEEVNEADKVASRFKDPAHQAKYLEYVKQGRHDLWKVEGMMEHHTGLTLKDVSGLYDPALMDSGRDERMAIYRKHFRNPMRKWMEKNCPTHYDALARWQGSTHSEGPMAFKLLHAKLEGDPNDVLWRNDIDVKEGKRIAEEVSSKPKVIDEYIRMRALNQAFMEKIGFTEIELMRGTGGPEGRDYSAALRKNPNTDVFEIQDANLAGYTSSNKVSRIFGIDEDGVTCRRTVRQGDVIVHKDMFGGITDSWLEEYEFIVKGGAQYIPIHKVDYKGKDSRGYKYDVDADPKHGTPMNADPIKGTAQTKVIKVEGGSGWLEDLIKADKALPTKDEADFLYKEGMINKADKDALYALVSV